MVVFKWFRLWAPLGALLGPSWPILLASWWLLAPPWEPLGTFLGLLGRRLVPLGASLATRWDRLGGCWRLFGSLVVCLVSFGLLLGASWAPLWRPLGASWVGDLSQGQNFIIGNEVPVLSENGWGVVGVRVLYGRLMEGLGIG